jgi:hypothetical protein
MKKLDKNCMSTPCPRQRGICRAPWNLPVKISLSLSLTLSLSLSLSAQILPPGYILQYKQDFTKPAAVNDFWFNRASLWRISTLQGNGFLHADAVPPDSARGDMTVPVANRAVLKNRIFGDVVLEADVRLPESRGAEAAILLGMKDSTKYYFIRLSADSTISPGIFLYKNGRVTALPLRISQPALLKPAVWQKVRVERNIVTRIMRVYVGNLSAPVMETKDYELIMGYLGFGAAEGAVRVDNVRVWAPTMLDDSEK